MASKSLLPLLEGNEAADKDGDDDSEEPLSLTHLSTELLLSIAVYAGHECALPLFLTCKATSQLAHEERLWERLARNKVYCQNVPDFCSSWKEVLQTAVLYRAVPTPVPSFTGSSASSSLPSSEADVTCFCHSQASGVRILGFSDGTLQVFPPDPDDEDDNEDEASPRGRPVYDSSDSDEPRPKQRSSSSSSAEGAEADADDSSASSSSSSSNRRFAAQSKLFVLPGAGSIRHLQVTGSLSSRVTRHMRIFAGTWTGQVFEVHLATNNIRCLVSGLSGPVYALRAYDPFLFCGVGDGKMAVYDVRSGQLLESWRAHAGAVTDLCIMSLPLPIPIPLAAPLATTAAKTTVAVTVPQLMAPPPPVNTCPLTTAATTTTMMTTSLLPPLSSLASSAPLPLLPLTLPFYVASPSLETEESRAAISLSGLSLASAAASGAHSATMSSPPRYSQDSGSLLLLSKEQAKRRTRLCLATGKNFEGKLPIGRSPLSNGFGGSIGTGAVVVPAFEANRQRVVTSSYDGSIRVWHIPKHGKLLWTLKGHRGPVWSIACGGGGTIYSSSADGTVKAWKPILKQLHADGTSSPVTPEGGSRRSPAHSDHSSEVSIDDNHDDDDEERVGTPEAEDYCVSEWRQIWTVNAACARSFGSAGPAGGHRQVLCLRLVGDALFAGCSDGTVIHIKVSTGEVVWKAQTLVLSPTSAGGSSSQAITSGVVVCAGGSGSPGATGACTGAATGAPYRAPHQTAQRDGVRRLDVLKSRMYACTLHGHVACFDFAHPALPTLYRRPQHKEKRLTEQPAHGKKQAGALAAINSEAGL